MASTEYIMERHKARSSEIVALEAWVRQSIFNCDISYTELSRALFNVIDSTLKFQSGPIFHLPISEELYHLSEYAKSIPFGGPRLDPTTRVNNMVFDITAQILSKAERRDSGNLYEFSPSSRSDVIKFCESAVFQEGSVGFDWQCKICAQKGFSSVDYVVRHSVESHPGEYFKKFGNGARSPTPWRTLSPTTKKTLLEARVKSNPLADAQLGFKDNCQVIAKTDIEPGAPTRKSVGAIESKTMLDKLDAAVLHRKLLEYNSNATNVLARRLLPISPNRTVDLGDTYTYSMASFVDEATNPDMANAAFIAHNIGHRPGSPILTLIFLKKIEKGSEIRTLRLSKSPNSTAHPQQVSPAVTPQQRTSTYEGPSDTARAKSSVNDRNVLHASSTQSTTPMSRSIPTSGENPQLINQEAKIKEWASYVNDATTPRQKPNLHEEPSGATHAQAKDERRQNSHSRDRRSDQQPNPNSRDRGSDPRHSANSRDRRDDQRPNSHPREHWHMESRSPERNEAKTFSRDREARSRRRSRSRSRSRQRKSNRSLSPGRHQNYLQSREDTPKRLPPSSLRRGSEIHVTTRVVSHGKLAQEAVVQGNPELFRVGGQEFKIVDYSNLSSAEDSGEVSEADMPISKYGDMQRQKLFKDRASKIKVNGNDIFQKTEPKFYSTKSEDLDLNAIPLRNKHALMEWAFDHGEVETPGTYTCITLLLHG